MANLLGGHLIDRNARVNIGPRRFAHPHTREKRSVGPGMVACAIGSRRGVNMIQPAQHLHAVFQILQRLHRVVEFELRSFRFRPPRGRNRAIGEVHERHSHGRAGGAGCQRRAGFRFGRPNYSRQECFKRRQCHAGPQPSQKSATIKTRPVPGTCGGTILQRHVWPLIACFRQIENTRSAYRILLGRDRLRQFPAFLELGRLNNSRQKCRKPAVVLLQPVHDVIDRIDVIIR